MADFPKVIEFDNHIITPLSFTSIGEVFWGSRNTIVGSVAWPTANLAIYIPFYIYTPRIITTISWINITAGTDSVDVGIYGQDGSKLVSSGSVLTSGSSAVQTADITDTTLNPGFYYMAMAVNGTTATFRFPSSITAPQAEAFGIYEQTSAFNLPSTATFAVSSRTILPIIALSTHTTV